jgi:hypothetical protein
MNKHKGLRSLIIVVVCGVIAYLNFGSVESVGFGIVIAAIMDIIVRKVWRLNEKSVSIPAKK